MIFAVFVTLIAMYGFAGAFERGTMGSSSRNHTYGAGGGGQGRGYPGSGMTSTRALINTG